MSEIPVIRIELERMRHTFCAMLGEHMAKMDRDIRAAIEAEITPERVGAMLRQQAAETLREAIKSALEASVRYGAGAATLRQMVDARVRELLPASPEAEER